MLPLKLWFCSVYRQNIFLVLSLILIITITLCNILQISTSLRIVLQFIPFVTLIIWFGLWFSLWGKVWILFSTLLLAGSQLSSIFPSGHLLLLHILFLLLMMFLFERRETQKQAVHQRHLKTMHALLRQNPPLIQTVDYTSEAVILLDNTGLIIESNSQSSSLLSLPESHLVGNSIFDSLGILADFQPNNIPDSGEFSWTTPIGVTKQLKFRTRPLLDDNLPSGTLVTLFDISEAKKRSEASLQIEKLSIISQVSAGLAHEIRNPLTTIKGFMQLINPEQWPVSFRPYQELILDEIQTIDQLLNQFILLTSPTAPQIKRLNLIETIHTVKQEIQDLLSNYDLILVLKVPAHSIYIMADPEQLLQALLSILKNAIEASPKGEKITIRVTEEDLYVRISVIDNGPGIPENLRQRVLDPFFTTHKEGTGLGLTIAQQIVLTHQGKLHFSESSSSSGTEVSVEFPSLSTLTDSLSA